MPRQSEYKPLLYTTTVRNPERYKDFIHLLKKFDGQILTADIGVSPKTQLQVYTLKRTIS